MSPRAPLAAVLVGLLASSLAVVGGLVAPAAGLSVQPDRIRLDRGFEPEGIAAQGPRFYTGSLVGAGVATGRFSSDRAEPTGLLPGTSLRGMLVDPRTGWLWVVGSRGSTGRLWVLDPSQDTVVSRAVLPHAAFPNDITFTRGGAWVTDSGRTVLYRLDRSPHPVPSTLPVDVLRLDGVPAVAPGDFGLNGIRTLPHGRLVAVDSRDGTLYQVRRSDGSTRALPVTGDVQLLSGDGLAMDGDTLWVVRGQGGNDVVQLQLTSGDDGVGFTDGVVLTDDDLSVPSTAVVRHDHLWLVNARFGVDTDHYYLSRLRTAEAS